jgi:hypothetical protein
LSQRPPGNQGEFPDLVPDLAPPPPRAAPPPPPKAALALPPIEEPAKAETPSEPPGPIDFGGAIDLDVPGAKNAPPPPGPGPAFKPGNAATPQMQAYKPIAQQVAEQMKGMPPPAAEPYPGAKAAANVSLDLSTPADPIKPATEQLQDAARKAAVVGRELGREVAAQTKVVAGKTKEAAVAAAIASIGGAEPKKVIRIEDPNTWLKPMMGPLVAFGLAIVLTLIAVVAGGSGILRTISILLLLGSIVFGVIRWIRLQSEE